MKTVEISYRKKHIFQDQVEMFLFLRRPTLAWEGDETTWKWNCHLLFSSFYSLNLITEIVALQVVECKALICSQTLKREGRTALSLIGNLATENIWGQFYQHATGSFPPVDLCYSFWHTA